MRIVVVDGNSLGYISGFTLDSLNYNQHNTGTIFGFLRHLKLLAKKFDVNKFAFCWDSRKSKRKLLNPDYKLARKKDRTLEEEIQRKMIFEQLSILRLEILPKLGFKNNFIATGFESDDLIASIVNSNNGEFIIATLDSDLLQLLSPNCHVYNLRTKNIILEDDFIKDKKISAKKWPLVKAISGCNSDNVKGIFKIGEKTAIKYLRNEIKSKTILDKIKNNWNLVEQNLKLVKLPFEGTPTIILDFNETFSLDYFLELCDRYDFKSFLKKEELNDWKKIFCIS